MTGYIGGASTVNAALSNIQRNVRLNGEPARSRGQANLNTGALADRKAASLNNITRASKILDKAEIATRDIQSFLNAVQTKTTSLAAIVDSTSTSDIASRETLVNEINSLGQRIHQQVDLTLYEDKRLLDGTFAGENRIVYATGYTDAGTTRLPNYINFEPQGTELNLGELLSDEFQAAVEGDYLSSDSDALSVSQFSRMVSESLTKVSQVLTSTESTSERLSNKAQRIRDQDTYETDDTQTSTALAQLVSTFDNARQTLGANVSSAVYTQGNLNTGGILRILASTGQN